jgi:hypothetical protein
VILLDKGRYSKRVKQSFFLKQEKRRKRREEKRREEQEMKMRTSNLRAVLNWSGLKS